MLAASTGNVELMKLLIEHGVPVRARDLMGRTAMQYASNVAAAAFLEKQATGTIPYPGREWIELRVDSDVKRGAGVICCCSVQCMQQFHWLSSLVHVQSPWQAAMAFKLANLQSHSFLLTLS